MEDVSPTRIKPWVNAVIALSVVAAVAVITLVVLMSITLTNGARMKRAFMYAGTNNNFCDKPGVVCTLATIDDLPMPDPGVAPTVYSSIASRYAADLIVRLALHRNEQKLLVPPPGLVELAVLDSELNDHLGWVLTDNPTTPTVVWVVFRGTSSREEWQKDFELQQIPYAVSLTGSRISEIPIPKIAMEAMVRSSMFEGEDDDYNNSVKIHKGFLGMYRGLRAKLIHVLGPYVGLPVYVCGHSLGAALAHICTLDLSINAGAPDLRTYTFAPPRIGNPAFARALNTSTNIQGIFQVVNLADLVFSVPLAVMPNIPDPQHPWLYEHAGSILYFMANRGSWIHNHTLSVYIKNLDNVNILNK